VAGVITMVMSIRAGAHARTLHADRPSAYVDWAAGNVALAAGPAPWPANGHPRRAGVSSFGISGTNAHLILEEPPAAEPGDCAPSPGADGAPVPWVLSAKTGQSLRVMAAQLSDFIAAHPGTAPAGVGISLARTRTGFRHRAVTVGATLSEHLAALAALARGERAPGLVTGEATATAKTAELSAGRRPRAGDASQELARLAEAYVGGAAVSWEAAFTGTGTGPVRLPGYPFQRERYWLDAPVPADRAMIAVAGEPAHPLLGAAIDLADSADQWFTRTLTPREPWYTAQYRLCGAHALPPAAIAEWALAASRHAGRESGGAPTIENLAFGDPVTFPGRLPLAIEAAAEASGAVRKVRGFSRNPGDADSRWTRRFTALASGDSPPDPGPVDLGQLRSRMTERDPGALFARLGERGIDYGPAFRHITGSWQSVDEALVLIDAGAAAADGDLYGLHPVVLETCFLSAMPLACDAGLWLPSGLARLTHYRELPRRLWCHARRALGNAAQGGPLHLELLSDSGEPLVVITGLTYDAADPAALAPPAATLAETETARSWDADELSRLALEQPETARQALMDILLGRVTDLVESPPADRESLRTRFGSARLGELGLDSLRVMRLREEFRAQLRVDVPPQRLLGDATVADIADLVCRFLAARNLVMTADEPGTAGQPEELIL
jgi:acyl transferase domain-containing protein/aryl carrier-like protein